MNDSKNDLAEILKFAAERAASGKMTMEEADSWMRVLIGNCTIWATVEELADFYGQSQHNVRCIINRKMLDKPKRRVYYSFNKFRKLVPKNWKCRMNTFDNQPNG